MRGSHLSESIGLDRTRRRREYRALRRRHHVLFILVLLLARVDEVDVVVDRLEGPL